MKRICMLCCLFLGASLLCVSQALDKKFVHMLQQDSTYGHYFRDQLDLEKIPPYHTDTIQDMYVLWFADRCGDTVAVIDTLTYRIVDVCAHACTWLRREDDD